MTICASSLRTSFLSPSVPRKTLSHGKISSDRIVGQISRSLTIRQARRFQLDPVGDGDQSHLDEDIPPITALSLPLEGMLEVGRVDGTDLQVPIPTVSSRHAMLKIADDTVVVTDLGSTNGTFIDGEKVGLKLKQTFLACTPDVSSSVFFLLSSPAQLAAMASAQLGCGSVVTFGDPSLASFQLIELKDDDA
jgi:hypothetical protein